MKIDVRVEVGWTDEQMAAAVRAAIGRIKVDLDIHEWRRGNITAQREMLVEWRKQGRKNYIPPDSSMPIAEWVKRNEARAESLRQMGQGPARRWASMREVCWKDKEGWWSYMITPEEGRVELGPCKSIHDAYKWRRVALLWEGVE